MFTLHRKVVASAMGLTTIAILLTCMVNYVVCANIIQDKAMRLESVIHATNRETARSYIDEIEEMINQSMYSESLEYILARQDASYGYTYHMHEKAYHEYLAKLILHKPYIEGFVLIYDELCIYPLNVREENLHAIQALCRSPEALSARSTIVSLPDPRKGQAAYVRAFDASETTRDHPIFIAVILDRRLAEHLTGDDAVLASYDLSKQIEASIVLGGAYLLAVFLISHGIGKRIVAPILAMNRRLSNRIHGPATAVGEPDAKRRIRLNRSLLILYSALVGAPVLLISVGFYTSAMDAVENDIGYAYQNSVNIFFERMEAYLNRFFRTAVNIAYSDSTHEFICAINQGEINPSIDVNRLILQEQVRNTEIQNVMFFDIQGEIAYSSIYSLPYVDAAGYRRFVEQLIASQHPNLWLTREDADGRQRLLFLMKLRPLRDQRYFGVFGYALIEYDMEPVHAAIRLLKDYDDIAVRIATREGAPIYADSARGGAGYDLRLRYQTLNHSWDLSVDAVQNKFHEESKNILFIWLIMAACLYALCFLCARVISTTMGASVQRLIGFVQQVRSGCFAKRFHPKTRDEIEELGDTFNELLDKLQSVIDDKLESELKVKDALLKAKEFELNLLQSQINPHFLYNTLRTIRFMAREGDSRTEEMVALLIKFLRSNIIHGEKLITLQEEIDSVNTYLSILSIRYGDILTVTFQVDEAAWPLYVLKLTLQPFIENAVNHGIMPKGAKGSIWVEVSLAECLEISITDDGVGMSSEDLARIVRRLDGAASDEGIGIANVHERVRIFFGAQYGVSIQSEVGKGTRALLRVPIIAAPDPV